MMLTRRGFISSAAVTAMGTGVSWAQSAAPRTKIRLAYVISADFLSAFVAKEKGFFDKRGLDVEFTFIPLTSTTLPAVIQSKSIDVAGMTPTVMLQAIDGGLDLMAVAGGGVANSASRNIGVIVRNGVNVNNPADFVGKKIATPGVGSVLHVLFRHWLLTNGVDPLKVSYPEVPYTTMTDVLRSGNVDAAIASDPTMSRIVGSGAGEVRVRFTEALKAEVPIILHSASREWAEANPAAVRAYRESLVEGAQYAVANDAEARDILAKYIKIPPEAIAKAQLPKLEANLTIQSIEAMIEIMNKQKMLQTKIDPARVVFR